MAKRTPGGERTAALFLNGRSQAVRLPREFRFEGDRVHIRREGEKVILEPIEKPGWPAGFWEEFAALPPISDAFVDAVREIRTSASWRHGAQLTTPGTDAASNDADEPRTGARGRHRGRRAR